MSEPPRIRPPLENFQSDKTAVLPFDPVAALQALVATHGLNTGKLSVALEADRQGSVRVCQKHLVPVTDGAKIVPWEVSSLAALWRGDGVPPDDIGPYPASYRRHFFFLEQHFLTLCDGGKDRTDQEMEEIFSALRRRPDGRSLGTEHDFMWQVAALLVGMHAVSAAEYNAILDTLVRSTRKWALRPVSRNYAAFLRETLRNS
jgi:hypothetical protein